MAAKRKWSDEKEFHICDNYCTYVLDIFNDQFFFVALFFFIYAASKKTMVLHLLIGMTRLALQAVHSNLPYYIIRLLQSHLLGCLCLLFENRLRLPTVPSLLSVVSPSPLGERAFLAFLVLRNLMGFVGITSLAVSLAQLRNLHLKPIFTTISPLPF
jgi:hypothetical protein